MISIEEEIKEVFSFKWYVKSRRDEYYYFSRKEQERGNAKDIGHRIIWFKNLQAFKEYMECAGTEQEVRSVYDYELFDKQEMLDYLELWLENLLEKYCLE